MEYCPPQAWYQNVQADLVGGLAATARKGKTWNSLPMRPPLPRLMPPFLQAISGSPIAAAGNNWQMPFPKAGICIVFAWFFRPARGVRSPANGPQTQGVDEVDRLASGLPEHRFRLAGC